MRKNNHFFDCYLRWTIELTSFAVLLFFVQACAKPKNSLMVVRSRNASIMAKEASQGVKHSIAEMEKNNREIASVVSELEVFAAHAAACEEECNKKGRKYGVK